MSQPPARAGLNRIELRAFLKRIGRDTRVERSKMAASRTLLAAAAIGVASLAFAGGLAASSATAAPPGQPPIVNADAWTETVAEPVQAISVQMAAAAPEAELVELPLAGHLTPAEAPDAFVDVVNGWLTRRFD